MHRHSLTVVPLLALSLCLCLCLALSCGMPSKGSDTSPATKTITSGEATAEVPVRIVNEKLEVLSDLESTSRFISEQDAELAKFCTFKITKGFYNLEAIPHGLRLVAASVATKGSYLDGVEVDDLEDGFFKSVEVRKQPLGTDGREYFEAWPTDIRASGTVGAVRNKAAEILASDITLITVSQHCARERLL